MIDKETLEKYEYYKERLLWLGGEPIPKKKPETHIRLKIPSGELEDGLEILLLDIHSKEAEGKIFAFIWSSPAYSSGNLLRYFKDFTAPTEEEKILFEIETGGCPYPIMEGWFDGWGK